MPVRKRNESRRTAAATPRSRRRAGLAIGVTFDAESQTFIVRLSGRLDLMGAADLTALRFMPPVGNDSIGWAKVFGTYRVVIDLADLEAIEGSGGCQALDEIFDVRRNAGRPITEKFLLNACKRVKKELECARVDYLLE